MALKKITDEEMDAAGVVAAPDVLSGTPAQNKAVFDRMVRQLVAPAYNAAVDAINEIDGVEKGIETAEAQRVAAENARAAAETARENAETARQTAETERQNAEAARQSAETAREDKETGYVADAEAWARGTRNGVAVGTSDPAYENNAAYYRDQARSAVGGEYVSFGQPQTLTSAQKAQARSNIGIAYPCNPNLLDNWYFGRPVNQRGKTSYTAAGYTIDRWITTKAMPVTAAAGGITLSPAAGSAMFRQVVDMGDSTLGGRQCTCSVLVTANTCASAVNVLYGVDTLFSIPAGQTGLFKGTKTLSAPIGSDNFKIMRSSAAEESGALTLLAVKLELGDTQTLAHQDANGSWVLNEIPDYGEQLRRCQRYLQVIASNYDTAGNGVLMGYANNSVDFWAPIPLITSMRASPTPSCEDVSLLKVGQSSDAVTAVTAVKGGWAANNGSDCCMRSIILSATGLTKGAAYTLFMLQGARIMLSAEL